MSYDSSTGKTSFRGSATFPSLTLDEVLHFKYLGVPLGCSPYSLFKSFNQQVCKRAKDYLTRVLSLTKRGPDRSELSFTLWTQVALPSILYGTEVIPITDATIKEVEKCNAKVGKYILQIPASSANICANITLMLDSDPFGQFWQKKYFFTPIQLCQNLKLTGQS